MLTVDFSRLNLQAGDRILDVGCGTGRHTAAAARFAGVTVIGVDLDFKDLEAACGRLDDHRKFGLIEGKWSLAAGDIGRLPFGDGCFDLVICSEVLEHIPDHQRAMGELSRILKPHKNLVVSVPRFWPEAICWALSDAYHTASGGHLRIYRPRRLLARLAAAGLRPWARHYAHGLHTPYWWLKCLLGPNRENALPAHLYHDFLVWDMMKRPALTRCMEQWLNPLLGKSIVFYLRKVA